MKNYTECNDIYGVFSTGDFNVLQNVLMQIQTHFIFRGQSDIGWHLQPKIERYDKLIKEKKAYFEYLSYDKFTRSYSQYVDKSYTHELEIVSLMQHYGAPTRLLDFTFSPFIALYMALREVFLKEEKEKKEKWQPIALYAISREKLDDHFCENVGTKKRDVNLLYNEKLNYFSRIFPAHATQTQFEKLCFFITPPVFDERMSNQQSVFLVQSNISCSFEENLAASLNIDKEEYNKIFVENPEKYDLNRFDYKKNGSKFVLMKLIIPPKLYPELFQFFQTTNILENVLFPGIEGFARSMDDTYISSYCIKKDTSSDNSPQESPEPCVSNIEFQLPHYTTSTTTNIVKPLPHYELPNIVDDQKT